MKIILSGEYGDGICFLRKDRPLDYICELSVY
jgi:hypothetical protein